MLNIYEYHNNPQSLLGYKDRIKLIPDLALEHALKRKYNRSPELEPAILKDLQAIIDYSTYIIKGRWKEAEPIIIKDPFSAWLYSNNIIKGRWPEAENTIKKHPQAAWLYSQVILKHRWLEAENTIKKQLFCWHNYKQHFNIIED